MSEHVSLLWQKGKASQQLGTKQDQEPLARAQHQNIRPGTISCNTKAAILNPCPGYILSAFCWNANSKSGTRESRSLGLETASNFQNGSYINIKSSLEGKSHPAGGRGRTAASLCALRWPGKTPKPPAALRLPRPQPVTYENSLYLTCCLIGSTDQNESGIESL